MAATRAWEQRNAELEAMVADLCASMKQTNQTHGSDHFSRSGEYRRFGEDEEEDPLAELKKLKETDGIRQYHQKFENIRTRLKLPEDYLMSVYLAGLRLETRRHIKMFQPQTVRDCFFLGKAYEKVHPKPPMTAIWNPKSVNSMDYSRDRSALDRNTSPSMEAWRSGSSHSERSGDDRWFSEEDRKFREYLMLRNNDDDETWTETDWWYRSEKENPEDQVLNCEELVESEVATDPIETEHELVSQVVDSVSEVLLVHKMDSYVMEVEELSQKSTNGNGENVAHQLFDQMPLRVASKEKRIKHLKAWKFKFKPTSKRSKLRGDVFSFVEETAWFKKDPKETIWECVKKEFRETMASCGKKKVDQRKKESEKERKWEDVRHSGSLQSYYDDQVKSTELVVRYQTKEVRSDVVYSPWVSVKRDGVVETQTCSSRRANHVWKPGKFVHPKIQLDWLERADSIHEVKQAWIENAWFKIQVFSDFDIASWVGLEIYGCETKKQTLLIVKLANRVWERGKLLATHLYWELFGSRALIWLEIHSWKYKKQINIGHISLNGTCNNLVYDEEKKKLRHVGDDVKKGKNSFLRDVKIILALAVKEYRMGKAAERLLPEHYGLLHTFDQCGGLNAIVIAGTIMQPFPEMKQRELVSVRKSFGYLMETHGSQYKGLGGVDNVPTTTHLPSVLQAVFVKEPDLSLERQSVKRQGKAITKVLVKWMSEPAEDANWEFKFDLQKKFPELLLNLEDKVVWRGKMCYRLARVGVSHV